MAGTKQRWCKWHVFKKAKESLGGIYGKISSFKRDFHDLIDEFMLPHEFESRWNGLILEHKLQDNQFMSRAYEN